LRVAATDTVFEGSFGVYGKDNFAGVVATLAGVVLRANGSL
jgi:hypothetical protein